MDFALSANQESIRDAVGKICSRFDDAYWLKKDKEGGYPADFHRAHVPYNIVLVDAAEGFRMMAHGDNDLAIGDKVIASYRPFAGRLVPYFEKI